MEHGEKRFWVERGEPRWTTGRNRRSRTRQFEQEVTEGAENLWTSREGAKETRQFEQKVTERTERSLCCLNSVLLGLFFGFRICGFGSDGEREEIATGCQKYPHQEIQLPDIGRVREQGAYRADSYRRLGESPTWL
jgi:hypothetical protein